MTIHWDINDNDIQQVTDFVALHQNHFVNARISRNVNRNNIVVDRDWVIKTMTMCLLTSTQRSGPNHRVGIFLAQNPFPLTYKGISESDDVEDYIRGILQHNGLNRYNNRIPQFFASNLTYLETNNWQLVDRLLNTLDGNVDKTVERQIADEIDDMFQGFGPKQARNFLQALGLTKYEIPIDSRITTWLNNFGFPVTLSSSPLQDKGYYHFVSDGIQLLCEEANIYPCVFDAALFSSYDNNQWNEANIVF